MMEHFSENGWLLKVIYDFNIDMDKNTEKLLQI